jgi:hypothetical protein
MVANPFATGATIPPSNDNGKLFARSNVYYRLFGVKNLM